MMKPERTVSTEKEDKQEFISFILLESMNNPYIYKVIQYYAHKYSHNPQNPFTAIFNEHYEEILQALIKTLLMKNMKLQSSFEEYIKMDVRPILVSKEVFNDISK